MLVGTVTIIALQFPEMMAWHRLRRPSPGDPPFERTRFVLRVLLRIRFSFFLLLLAHALLRPVPTRWLVYPIVLVHLGALIAGDRDLRREIPESAAMDRFVRFLIAANVAEIGVLAIIALQMHGIVPA